MQLVWDGYIGERSAYLVRFKALGRIVQRERFTYLGSSFRLFSRFRFKKCPKNPYLKPGCIHPKRPHSSPIPGNPILSTSYR